MGRVPRLYIENWTSVSVLRVHLVGHHVGLTRLCERWQWKTRNGLPRVPRFVPDGLGQWTRFAQVLVVREH